MKNLVTYVGIAALAAGCATASPDLPRGIKEYQREMVMTSGMEIAAQTSSGLIRIISHGDFRRTYNWENCTREVELLPRQERWRGGYGAYHAGGSYEFLWGLISSWTWKECNGIARPVAEEGQMHFRSEEDALKWINEQKWINPVYTSDGLIIGWKKVPQRKQLNVEVWQIFINGKKPQNLPGADSRKVFVKYPR